MSQDVFGCPVVIDDRVNGWELVPPHTIETRHILAAIPGDTNRQKLAWVQARAACACGGNCDKGEEEAAKAMAKALGEIEAALLEDVKAGDAGYVIEKIAAIVDGVE